MANEPIGFLCYNNRDLVRDGFIWPLLTKSHHPDDFPLQRLDSPEPGVSYTVTRDDEGKIISILERRKQIPASKIKLEILFSKLLKSALSNPITPGFLAGFGGIGGGAIWTVGQGLLPMGIGGITSGTTELTYHLCDAETRVNVPIKVTNKIKDTGIVTFDSYILSVFGVVKQHIEEVEEGEGEDVVTKEVKYGINFSQEDLDRLGQYSAGQFEGTPRRDIRGATNDDGLFGGRYTPEIKIDDLLFDDQEQLFIIMIKDGRKQKFRADNSDASGDRAYPPEARDKNDITNNQIRIKTDDLVKDDIIYITYSSASIRRIRQTVRHRGSIFQDNSIGVVTLSPQSEINSRIDVFDYQMREWPVPDDVPAADADDDEYTLSLFTYLQRILNEKESTILEGWRLSEAVTDQVKYMWAADYRGILLVSNKGQVAKVLDREKIRDQTWFKKYLEDEKFEYTVNEDGKLLTIRNKIEEMIDMEKETGYLFDISEVNNTFLFDRQKVHYYRPFALALRNVSRYKDGEEETGVGMINLDYALDYLLRHNYATLWNFEHIEEGFTYFFEVEDHYGFDSPEMDLIRGALPLMDLSNAVFKYTKVRPLKSWSCEGDNIHPDVDNHYSCHTYAPGDGPGAYFTIGYIVNEVFLWRPGGYADSDWNYATPYFCGEFTRKTRAYMEDIGGNSLNNYSMIYADTLPISPDTISLDTNNYVDISLLTFNEQNMHFGEAYHKVDDGFFEDATKFIDRDESLNHVKESFENDKYKYIGYSNILGARPSYSRGSPITNEISAICHNNIKNFFFSLDLTNPEYGLNFDDDQPILTLPTNTAVGAEPRIKEINIRYKMKESGLSLKDEDQYISLHFKGSESVINDIFLPIAGLETALSFKIDCKYYKDGPIEFLGEFWKHIEVESIGAIVVGDALDTYKTDAGQSDVIFDRMGRIMLFYADEEIGNISVAMSHNEGKTWSKYRGILRMVEGETVSLPVVIKDAKAGALVHLFYILNDTFIMYRPVNTDQFNVDDLFVDYAAPASYDEESDDDVGDNEQSSLFKFSDSGKELRRQPSYFILGDSGDTFFTRQMEINDAIDEKNGDKEEGETDQRKRFLHVGSESNMKNKFNGNPYAVYIDDSGVKRLFTTIEYKLYIKRSPDFFRWEYDVEGVQIHKNFFDEVLNEGEIPEVKNIQIVRSELNDDAISLLYFHDDMLFMRNFESNILLKSRDDDDTDMVNHLEVVKGSNNLPLFLVGKLSDEIKNGLDDDDLAINIPYSTETIEKFNDSLAVDSDTQVFGYHTRRGLVRIFYKDSLDQLEGLWVNGLISPVLESWFKLKDEFV